MTRAQLEHILRAAGAITGAEEFIVVGSQSILGAHPEAPESLRASMEADIFTLRSPQDAELIDGSIGEESPFHLTFGYFAHGVGEDTALLPRGWKGRLVRIQCPPTTGSAIGLCLDPDDLAASKLLAGREKDSDYVAELIRHGLASSDEVERRLAMTEAAPPVLSAAVARLSRIAATS